MAVALCGDEMSDPLVSVIINNYNYGRFLAAAIESVLAQTYRSIETVVVDDGSTDESRDIICGYDALIVPILQTNKGQASAFNAGVLKSHGTILCFLDADDFYYGEKVERVVELFCRNGINSRPIMVHHRLALRGEQGEDLDGQTIGKTHESPLNVYSYAKRYRYFYYPAGPTTGLSLNRMLADRLFPIPEHGVRVSADDFLVRGAALVGELFSMEEVLGGYRVHGNNRWFHSSKAKSKEFKDIERTYLNRKLVEHGMQPVISFHDSMHEWHELVDNRNWRRLAFQMAKLSLRQRDRYTAWFVRQTIKAAFTAARRRSEAHTNQQSHAC
jgi:glycosyltransferase involved in cell wall biosynthesis